MTKPKTVVDIPEIKRNPKHYYAISCEHICTVLLDEYIMKKANKLLLKYRNEMNGLLSNNTEHLIEQNWALAYPNKEQTSFYSSNPIKEYQVYTQPFTTRKVDNIFEGIGEYKIHDRDVIDVVKKIMESEQL